MASIRKLQEQIHETAKEKGWWEQERNIGEALALIHSEISEALEAYREEGVNYIQFLEDGKPEGFWFELSDAIIRILDLSGHYEVDMERYILTKMNYNKTRPYRHGNKRA